MTDQIQRCPTCKAPYKEKRYCHRCGTDIGRLLEIRDQAARHIEKAIAAYNNREWKQMYYHAARSFALYRTPSSDRLLACAALVTGNYQEALAIWTKTKNKNL
ncbi:MAG: hypothetical protein K9J79_02645 [Desulfobacteraceae bacterium]|nr:hypothetical protein [Desulfobacteraceae bacterium]MCF8094240.1 hypothetical protein [Desulfobacteraceae bacterium]